MINFELLDKRRTYIGLQYGTSFIAKQIKKYSKEYAPNSKEIPTHVLALKYRFGTWWIYESHADGHKNMGIPSGVRRYKQELWEQIENQDEFKAFPMKFSIKKLEDYIVQPYGTGDIKELMKASIFNSNGKQKDRKGLICSEYLALCNDEICKYYNLPAWCITPAHFQNIIDANGIEEVKRENGENG